MSEKINNIKVYFGKVVKVDDEDNKFRIKATISEHTDKISVDDLPYYYSWYGVNYLPEIGDEVPIVIFNDDFRLGFYEKKADNKPRELSKEDYNTYLELYKRDSDKVYMRYEKSKGIQLEYDKSKQQIDKDKVVITVNDTKLTIDDNQLEVLMNALVLKMTDSGFLIQKGGENMGKLWSDTLKAISQIQFINTNGRTVTMRNKADILKCKKRGENLFTK